MDEKIRKSIMNELTVPLWPTAGRALGLGRNATYEAAERGDIPTIKTGGAGSRSPQRRYIGEPVPSPSPRSPRSRGSSALQT